MALKIERMNVVNKQRGKVLLMARFDVNFGPMTVKGYELVKWDDGNVAIGEPYNLFTPRGEDKPKRFTYVFYNGDRGKAMQAQIFDAAREEFQRRNSAPQDDYDGGRGSQYNAPRNPRQAPPRQSNWDDDEPLPARKAAPTELFDDDIPF